MRIYAASSWRNLEAHRRTVDTLLDAGHEVFDFTRPTWKAGPDLRALSGVEPLPDGFAWSEISPNWKSWTAKEFRLHLLGHSLSKRAFGTDFAAMQWAEAFVLTLPSGRSSHLEFGWAVGAGKRTAVLMADAEPELMYRLGDALCCSLEELLGVFEDWSREDDEDGLSPADQAEVDRVMAEPGAAGLYDPTELQQPHRYEGTDSTLLTWPTSADDVALAEAWWSRMSPSYQPLVMLATDRPGARGECVASLASLVAFVRMWNPRSPDGTKTDSKLKPFTEIPRASDEEQDRLAAIAHAKRMRDGQDRTYKVGKAHDPTVEEFTEALDGMMADEPEQQPVAETELPKRYQDPERPNEQWVGPEDDSGWTVKVQAVKEGAKAWLEFSINGEPFEHRPRGQWRQLLHDAGWRLCPEVQPKDEPLAPNRRLSVLLFLGDTGPNGTPATAAEMEALAEGSEGQLRLALVGLLAKKPMPGFGWLGKTEPKEGCGEGERCNRDGCEGILGFQPVEDCTCHISPPCSACVNNPLACPKCDWQSDDEPGP